MSGKLYLITRADLRHGTQAAQLVHGMAKFASDYPQTFEDWERGSNVVVCLAVSNEEELRSLHARAEAISESTETGLAVSAFREPDLNDQLTCVVLDPIEQYEQLCRDMRLACR